MTEHARTSTGTPTTSSPPTWPPAPKRTTVRALTSPASGREPCSVVLRAVPSSCALRCEDPGSDEGRPGQHPARGPGQGVRALLRTAPDKRRLPRPCTRPPGPGTRE
ncbi:hypothetical protein [Ornithinimicrobium kibberense]|uniref:hypothetical protein n=1 Tax=Ornithinimicrobium kibberense TaxID=282060 RepID=UPI00360B7E36